MKALIIITLLIIIGSVFSISDRLREIQAHLRVLESLIDDLKCPQDKK